MTQALPFRSPDQQLKPEWIDYNGHLNMAYYSVLFDNGIDVFFEHLGLGPVYAEQRKLTTYTADAHIRYLKEIHLGDTVYNTIQLVDYDAKRLHCFAQLHHADGWLSATCETLTLHVDMTGPKVATFPDDIEKTLANIFAEHKKSGQPDGMGQPIGIRRK